MSSQPTREEQFIQTLIESVIGSTPGCDVERIEDELGVLLKVHVPRQDMGKVIGKNGRHVEAMKTLLKVVSARQGIRCSLKVIEKDTDS